MRTAHATCFSSAPRLLGSLGSALQRARALSFTSLGLAAGRLSSTRKDSTVLVLRRKKNEQIVIGDNVTITVVETQCSFVGLGIDAPRNVPVHREEVYRAIQESRTPGQDGQDDHEGATERPLNQDGDAAGGAEGEPEKTP